MERGDARQSMIMRTSRPAGEAGGQQMRLDFLCFLIGDEEFGVDLDLVRQIVKPPPVTTVPRVARHVLGVISIRGAVITLVDLRLLLGMEPTGWPRSAKVLIVEHEEENIGLLVDGVTQVRRMSDRDLEQDLTIDEGVRGEFVLFLARPDPRQPQKVVVIVDLETILTETLR